MYRTRLMFSSVLAVLALGAVTASSASAFSWWIETKGGGEEVLKAGVKEPFNEAANVSAPFILKWKKEFEVSCEGAKYKEAFLEGTVGLGASSIVFEICKVAKPANCEVVGGKLETAALVGGIKPVGTAVEFVFEPKAGATSTFVKFTLQGVGCAKKEVVVKGRAKGELTNPKELTKEKLFVFQNKEGGLMIEEHQVEANGGKVGYTSKSGKGWSAH